MDGIVMGKKTQTLMERPTFADDDARLGRRHQELVLDLVLAVARHAAHDARTGTARGGVLAPLAGAASAASAAASSAASAAGAAAARRAAAGTAAVRRAVHAAGSGAAHAAHAAARPAPASSHLAVASLERQDKEQKKTRQ